jgi:hypothetical protein
MAPGQNGVEFFDTQAGLVVLIGSAVHEANVWRRNPR